MRYLNRTIHSPDLLQSQLMDMGIIFVDRIKQGFAKIVEVGLLRVRSAIKFGSLLLCPALGHRQAERDSITAINLNSPESDFILESTIAQHTVALFPSV